MVPRRMTVLAMPRLWRRRTILIRMKSGEIVSLIRREYPSIQNNHSTKIHLGMAMKELGFEGKTHGNQTYYKVIPLKAA